MGNAWLSEPGKNLLQTIYLKPDDLLATNQFNITLLISVAIQRVLSRLIDEKVEIKWPNDIYVKDQKIAGILIETTLTGSKIEDVFIGFGLNVNQDHFQLPTATSIKILTGQDLDRHDLLEKILLEIEKFHDGLFHPHSLKQQYLNALRWLEETHEFKVNDEITEGTITGVSEAGKLQVNIKGQTREFGLKEIEFME